MNNKYGAKKTYSTLCGREFDSKGEAIRAEQLCLLEKAGEITGLEYQVPFILCEKPKVTYKVDYSYLLNGKRILEDFKGVLTRETRVKLAWLKERGIDVVLTYKT